MISLYRVTPPNWYCYDQENKSQTGLNKQEFKVGSRKNDQQELTRFKNYLYLLDINMIDNKFFYFDKSPFLIWERYLYICDKYDLTTIEPSTHKLVIKDGNYISMNRINRYISTIERDIFFDIHNIKSKTFEVCSACEKIPTGAKLKHKQCCIRFNRKKKLKRKLAFDINITSVRKF